VEEAAEPAWHLKSGCVCKTLINLSAVGVLCLVHGEGPVKHAWDNTSIGRLTMLMK
jgi:hypothetical protein